MQASKFQENGAFLGSLLRGTRVALRAAKMLTFVDESKLPNPARRVIALLESESGGGELAASFAERGLRLMSVAPVTESLVRELEEVRNLLDELASGRFELILFMTGSAVYSLVELTRELGRWNDLVRVLRHVATACRGPKARAALRSHGLAASLDAQPLNDARLVHGLAGLILPDQHVLRFNGDPEDALAQKLRRRRARVREVSLETRVSTNDGDEVTALVQAIVERRVEALVVTSELQFARLYQVARRLDCARGLVQALRRDVVVVATPGGASAVLEAHGLHPQLVPIQPQMQVLALLQFLEKRSAGQRSSEGLLARS